MPKTAVQLQRQAAGYMLAAANASARDSKKASLPKKSHASKPPAPKKKK